MSIHCYKCWSSAHLEFLLFLHWRRHMWNECIWYLESYFAQFKWMKISWRCAWCWLNWIVNNSIFSFFKSETRIGLSDHTLELEWRWLNGDLLSYERFAPSKPYKNSATNCIQVYPYGQWDDFLCWVLRTFLCSSKGMNVRNRSNSEQIGPFLKMLGQS